jgi:hypothetical protein
VNSSPWAGTSPMLMPLVRIALGEPLVAAAGAPDANGAAGGLAGLTGFYEGLRLGRGIAVTLEHDTLFAEPTGSGKAPLVLKSGLTYFVGREGSPNSVTFTVGEDGRATAMVLRGANGQERTFPKTR